MSTVDTSLQLTDSLESLLSKGTEKLNIDLDKQQVKQFLSYLTLLLRWNKVHNLTAIREPEAMVTHHLLDSLAVADTVKSATRLLDVGSGAGLPGLVLAILYPKMSISLVDSIQKKTAFLSQVKAELHLRNVTIHTSRVEKLHLSAKFDAIISRAFSDLSKFVALSAHLLAENGRFYAMKGSIPEEEIQALPNEMKVTSIMPLTVPFLDASRHLLVIEKKAT